jgi:hypothetical protein
MKISDAPEIHTAGKEQEYLSWSYRDLVYNPEAITEADVTANARATDPHLTSISNATVELSYINISSILFRIGDLLKKFIINYIRCMIE